MPRGWWGLLFFLGLWLALLTGGRSSLFRDPGTFWHTAAGERMLTSGRLLRVDEFSYTRSGERWIAHQWLGECAMAVVHRAAGLSGLLLATATGLALIYAGLARGLIRSGWHWLPAAAVVLVAVGASAHHFHVRPHLASIGGITAVVGLLCALEAGEWTRGRLVLLPLIVALWANVHGGVLAGVGSVGLVLTVWLAGWGTGHRSWAGPVTGGREAVLVVGAGLLTVLATLATPFGVETWRAWTTIMTANLPAIIEEHAPLRFDRLEGLCVAGLAVAWVACAAGVNRAAWRATWLLPGVLAVLAVDRVRHAPLFAVVAVIVIARMVPHTWYARSLIARGSDLFEPHKLPGEWPRSPARVAAGCVVLAAMVQSLSWPVPVIGSGWARLDAVRWPVGLEERVRGLRSGDRLFNELGLGGWVIGHAPGVPVFIDDRCELYGETFLTEYARGEREAPELLEVWRQEWQFTRALVSRGGAFDRYLETRAEWQLVAETTAARLYARRRSEE